MRKYPFIILFIIFFTAYSDVFLLNKTLNPFFLQDFGSSISDNLNVRNNFNHVDQGTGIFYEQPIKKFYGDSLKNLDYPFWNEHQAAGYPLYNQFSNMGLNPFFLFESLFSPKLYDFFIFIKLLIGAYGVFLLNKYLGQKNIYLLYISSIIYGFSSIFFWFNSLHQMIYFGSLFPFCLLYTIKSLDNNSYIPIAIFLNALLNYLGQPEIAFYCFVFQTFFILIIKSFSTKSLLHAGSILLIIYTLAILLSAPNILPQFNWLSYADNSLHSPGGSAGIASINPLVYLKIIFFPYISSSHVERFYFPINGHWDQIGGYILFTIVTLISISLFNLKETKNKLILLSSALFIVILLFKHFGVYPFVDIGKLPIFDQVWSNRWSNISWILALSIFVGNLNTNINGVSRRLLLILFIGFIMLSLYIYKWINGVIPINGEGFIHGEHFENLTNEIILSHIKLFSIYILISSLLMVYLFIIGHRKKFFITTLIIFLNYLVIFPKEFSPNIFLYQVIIFTLIIVSLCLCKRIKIYYLLCIPISIIILQVVNNNLPDNGDPFSKKDYIEFLKQKNDDYSRISGANGILYGNFSSAYGLDDISGIMSLPSEKFSSHYWQNNDQLSKDLNHSKPPWFSGVSNLVYMKIRGNYTVLPVTENINEKYLSDLSVKYLIFPKNNKINFKFLKEIYNDQEVIIYENLYSKPRYAEISKEYCNKVDNKLFCNTTFFNQEPVKPIYTSNNMRSFSGCSLRNKYLITTDLSVPGWVSNHNILEYNNMYRALELIESEPCSEIYMRYFPPKLKKSVYIFLFGIMLIIYFALGRRWFK